MSKKSNATVNTYEARMGQLLAHRAVESEDMQRVLCKSSKGENSVQAFTKSVNDAIDRLGINTDKLFKEGSQKAIMRFVQFIYAVNARDYKKIDKVTATIIYALQIAGDYPLTTEALQYVAAGLKTGRINPETRGVNRTTANKLFGRVGLSTVPTQASRTVGSKGFLQLVGATQGEGTRNASVKLDKSHPLVVAFNDCMNAATEKQVDEMVGEENA